MRVLIAPDKFKGSLTARAVAESIAIGLRDVLPDASIETMPVADGGEGTAAAICDAGNGEWVSCGAHDALGRAIEARYVWLAERRTAVFEMSEAAGMWRIAADERNLLRGDTYGVGEVIRNATERNGREIVVGLGGSATNDGGFGMARALGFRFFGNERELKEPAELVQLSRIEKPSESIAPTIRALADVRNPLLGARGATQTFGKQKGGTSDELELLERALERLADVVARDLGRDFRETASAGAAGGLGFGLLSFCGAKMTPGFEAVADLIGLRAAIEKSDVVITGEGSLDQQTLEGKAPAGVAKLARESGKRVFAIAGIAAEALRLHALFDGVFVLARDQITPGEAVARAAELLRERARELARML
jgi:glycerate kinase